MPRRFNFRYDQYLKLKKKIEEDKAVDFAMAMSDLQAEENKLKELENKKLVHMMLQAAITRDKIHELEYSANYLLQINQDIDKSKLTIQKTEKIVEEKRQILNEAIKDRRIIEKLKEKLLEDHRLELKKREEIQENETALQMNRSLL